MKKLYLAGIGAVVILLSAAQPAQALEKAECISLTRGVMEAFRLHTKFPDMSAPTAKQKLSESFSGLTADNKRLGSIIIDIAWEYSVAETSDKVRSEVFITCLSVN